MTIRKNKKASDGKKRRRIAKARIDFVSLCTAGVNNMPVILKGVDSLCIDPVFKAVGDTLLGVVAVPNVDDLEGEFIDKATIAETSADFLARRGSIDIEHDGKALDGAADIAASWIVDPGDTRFQGWTDNDGQPMDLDGAWAMEIKLNSPELRKAAADGTIGGLSMGGRALFEEINKSTADGPSAGSGSTADSASNPQSTDMDETQLIGAIHKALGLNAEPEKPLLSTLIAAEVKKAVTEALPQKKEDGAPNPAAPEKKKTEQKEFNILDATPQEVAEAAIAKACAGLDMTDPANYAQVAEVRKSAYEMFGVDPSTPTGQPETPMERLQRIAKSGPVAASSGFGRIDGVDYGNQPEGGTVALELTGDLQKSRALGGTTDPAFGLDAAGAAIDQWAAEGVAQWAKGKTVGERLTPSKN